MTMSDVIAARRSVRAYTDAPVTADQIRRLLDAAVQAPTAMHDEPWQFIVIQNRASGDGPVSGDEFSRIFLNTDPGDIVLSVVGNQTLDLHFGTGLRVKGTFFRAFNAINSTAPFVEIIVSGYLAKRPPGF